MSPITHFLASWVIADTVLEEDRDKILVAFAGLMPDLDSLGVVCDLVSPVLGGPKTQFFADYHHFIFHGLPGIVMIAAFVAWKGVNKSRVFWWAMVVAHFHLLCDYVGSRGPQDTIDDLWPIYYWGPFTREFGNLLWVDQWKLNGWQNVSFTVALLTWVFYALWRFERSPFRLLMPKLHQTLVETLRNRFGQPT